MRTEKARKVKGSEQSHKILKLCMLIRDRNCSSREILKLAFLLPPEKSLREGHIHKKVK